MNEETRRIIAENPILSLPLGTLAEDSSNAFKVISKKMADKRMEDLVNQIHTRGNDVELRKCKDGVKVIEVHRKVIAII